MDPRQFELSYFELCFWSHNKLVCLRNSICGLSRFLEPVGLVPNGARRRPAGLGPLKLDASVFSFGRAGADSGAGRLSFHAAGLGGSLCCLAGRRFALPGLAVLRAYLLRRLAWRQFALRDVTLFCASLPASALRFRFGSFSTSAMGRTCSVRRQRGAEAPLPASFLF